MKSRRAIANIFQSQYRKLGWCSEMLSDHKSSIFYMSDLGYADEYHIIEDTDHCSYILLNPS